MTSVLSQSGLQTLEGSSLGASASQTQLYNKGKVRPPLI